MENGFVTSKHLLFETMLLTLSDTNGCCDLWTLESNLFILKSELAFYFMVFLFGSFQEWPLIICTSFFQFGFIASGGVCERSAVGSNTQAVFTRVLNESRGLGWRSAALESSQPFCLKHMGPTKGPENSNGVMTPIGAAHPHRKQLSRLHNWNRSSKHTEGAWSRDSELQSSSSIWMTKFPTCGVFIMVGNIWTSSVREVDAKKSRSQFRFMVFNDLNYEKYLCGMMWKATSSEEQKTLRARQVLYLVCVATKTMEAD